MKKILIILTTLTLLSCTNSNDKNMGFFEKSFGNKDSPKQVVKVTPISDITKLKKTSEMLDETIYWNIVETSLKNTKDQNKQEEFLISEIEKLSPTEIIGFRLRTDKLLFDTYNSEMWCAAHIMNDGSSDDGFEYFRNWIISRGKEVYYRAKQKPDSLISEIVEGTDYYEFESFWYVAIEAFKNKTGKDLYDYIDNENFKTREGAYPQFNFTWKEEMPETMKKICPKLFDKLTTK